MKGKRIWSMILAVVMAMSLVLPAYAAAPKVTLSSGEVKAGETVTLTASIEGNAGISAYELFFYYDTDVFSVEGLQVSGPFKGKGNTLTNSIAAARDKDRYDGDPDQDGMLLLWYSSVGANVEGDGEMAAIRLRVKENAKSGEYSVGLGYSELNTINQKGATVSLATEGGKVTVLSKSNANSGNSGGGSVVVPDNTEDTDKEDEVKIPFDDIYGNWAEEYILEAADRNIVVGDKGHYYPNDNMTRAEFVMILWRVMGSPEPKGKATFVDLPMEWYQKPIAWAEENKIVDGYGKGIFDPEGNVTREQMMTILHRLAGRPTGMETMFTAYYDEQFADSSSVSYWAKAAVYWSIYQEIMPGESAVSVNTDKVLAPRAAATRSQIAVAIIRYLDR